MISEFIEVVKLEETLSVTIKELVRRGETEKEIRAYITLVFDEIPETSP